MKCDMPYIRFDKWYGTSVHERGEDYEQFKDQLAKHLLDILYETVPQCKGKVEYWTLGTPLTEVSYLSSFRAASYGTKCDTQIFSKLNDRWTTTPYTSIPGLTMAGSDAFLPAVCGGENHTQIQLALVTIFKDPFTHDNILYFPLYSIPSNSHVRRYLGRICYPWIQW